jgi:hypothetical protein
MRIRPLLVERLDRVVKRWRIGSRRDRIDLRALFRKGNRERFGKELGPHLVPRWNAAIRPVHGSTNGLVPTVELDLVSFAIRRRL